MLADHLDESLAARIAITKVGQVTWANPALGQKCETCRHLGNIRQKRDGTKVAICTLVKAHTRKVGKEFEVETATACSMWKEGA